MKPIWKSGQMTKSLTVVPGSQLDKAQKENISLAQSFLSAEIVIVFDNSGSMSENDAPGNQTRRNYAEKQLRYLQGKYPGKVALVCFASSVEYSPSGIITPVGGSTALHKALEFVKVADNTGLKIIVVSDGEPDIEDAALNVARTYKSKIDCVYCGPEDGTYGRDFLKRLAAATGGQFFKSDAPGQLLEQTETLLLGG